MLVLSIILKIKFETFLRLGGGGGDMWKYRYIAID